MVIEALDALAAFSSSGLSLPAALPDPAPIQPPGTEGIATVLGWAKWIGLVVAIFGIIIVAIIMSVNSRRGEGAQNVGTLGFIFMAVVLIGASTALIGFISGA